MTNLLVHPNVPAHTILSMGAVVSVEVGGVLLYIDVREEEAYIETVPGFQMAALEGCELMAHLGGYEVIGEDEAPAEEFEDGRVRHWLAQRLFLDAIDNEGEVAEAS